MNEQRTTAVEVEAEYRIGDFLPLFLRRQFAKPIVWVLHFIMITLAGIGVIYAIALSASGQTGQADGLRGWLLLPLLILVIMVLSFLYVSYANARVLLDFYREGGAQVRIRLSAAGIDVLRSGGTLSAGWDEITRQERLRRQLVFWKGETLPLVLPLRCTNAEQRTDIDFLLRQLTADTTEMPHEEEAAPEEAEDFDVIPAAPDYSDSEFQFGDEWVTGGVRMRFEVRREDREVLMEYSMVRPGARRLMILLAVLTLMLGVVMTLLYPGLDPETRSGMLLFIVLAYLFAALFWTGVFRPMWFLSIVGKMPGSRKRARADAVRSVLCVLYDDVLYAKTEGVSDRVPITAFYDIRQHRDRLMLFKTKKSAFVIPLYQLEDTTRQALLDALGDRVR